MSFSLSFSYRYHNSLPFCYPLRSKSPAGLIEERWLCKIDTFLTRLALYTSSHIISLSNIFSPPFFRDAIWHHKSKISSVSCSMKNDPFCLCHLFPGSVLDGGGRHASLMTNNSAASDAAAAAATLQLRDANLAGHKVNYLDSGYSEEDNTGVNGGQGDHQVTSCLMQTASGTIYIPGSKRNKYLGNTKLHFDIWLRRRR